MLTATSEELEIMRCLNYGCEKQYSKGRCINVCNAVNCDKKVTEETTKQKIQKIAQNYGYDAQSRQCIEEMAELTQAINKYWRKDLQCGKYPYNPWDGYMPDDSKEYNNLVEELADVQIMIWQMKFLLTATDFDKVIQQKLDRQMERIETE
mgnify:CR=1 FL=1